MTPLRAKVKNALDEGRTLILGVQVLVGFEFHSLFGQTFQNLSPITRQIRLAGLMLMLLALALLIAPASYHRIVERGDDSDDFLNFTTRIIELALLPFALGLGIDLYAAAEKVGGLRAGLAAGSVTAAVALFFWYGLELIHRDRFDGKEESDMKAEPTSLEPTKHRTTLEDKIDHVLTESRVVLMIALSCCSPVSAEAALPAASGQFDRLSL